MIVSAGDTILAEWVDEDVEITETISKAIQCAFQLPHVCEEMWLHGSNRPTMIGAC